MPSHFYYLINLPKYYISLNRVSLKTIEQWAVVFFERERYWLEKNGKIKSDLFPIDRFEKSNFFLLKKTKNAIGDKRFYNQ